MRFGLFGTGYWAAQTHAPALVAHPGVELIGVWGRDPAKAAALAEATHSRPYADIDDLIADVDAIAVSLPPDVQADIAIRAARAGRHLLLDKPLALDLESADLLVAAVEEAGVASTVFFTNRFFPNVVAFQDAARAESGWHGSRVVMFASIFEDDNPYAGSAWRKEHGGLWDIGPHALSIVVPVLGRVVAVSALDGPRTTAHLLLRHESGAASTVSLTLDAPADAALFRLELFGEPGTWPIPPGEGDVVGAYGRAIDHLLAREPGVGVHVGRDVVAVLSAAQTSIREGRTVPL
jgi:predicted dehydrogenase